jgi:hypothetical protein
LTCGPAKSRYVIVSGMATQNLSPTRKVNERRFRLNRYLVRVHRLESLETSETKGVKLTLYWPTKSCKAYFTTDNGQTFRHVVILPSSRLPDSVDMTTGDTESDPDIVAVLKNAFVRWHNGVLAK